MLYRFLIVIFSGAILLPTGCDAPSGTLQGTVMLGGKKVTSGSVIVHVGPDANHNPRGIIAEDGTYAIANLPKGTFPVTVHTHSRMPEGMQLKQKLPPMDPHSPVSPSNAVSYSNHRPVTIPRKFSVPEESGITTTIKSGVQTFDIELK